MSSSSAHIGRSGSLRSQYPDPFLDIASTRLPKHRSKLYETLWFYATQHPQIAPAIKRLARYPITNIYIANADESVSAEMKEQWLDFLNIDLDINDLLQRYGLNFMAYGDVYLKFHRPFDRVYTCSSCETEYMDGQLKYFLSKHPTSRKPELVFRAHCAKGCKRTTVFKAEDVPSDTTKGRMRFVFLNPKLMTIKTNSLVGSKRYFYSVPRDIRAAVGGTQIDRSVVDETPLTYILAAMYDKKIEFKEDSILHISEPVPESPDEKDKGYGLPIILAALRDAYLLQIYKRADETVANERTVPARFVYPAASGSGDPLRTIGLRKWSAFVNHAVTKWRQDKNSLIAIPFPIGLSSLGGESVQINTMPLRQAAISEIYGAMGPPDGFLSNTMSWTGATTQLRMLENSMSTYINGFSKVLNYIVRKVKSVTKWAEVDLALKPFSKTDDVQTTQLLMQLMNEGYVCVDEVLQRFGLSWEEQQSRVIEDQKFKNRMDGLRARGQANALVEAVAGQFEAEALQGDLGALRGEVDSDFKSTTSILLEGLPPDQSPGEHESAIEEEAQENAESEEDMTPMDEKRSAEAEKKVQSAAEAYARKMSGMSPDAQNEFLIDIYNRNPEVATTVQSILSSDKSLFEQLKSESGSVKALADKIEMLGSSQKKMVIQEMLKSDPALGIKVLQQLSGETNSGQQKRNDVRPMPQQRPPRRKN